MSITAFAIATQSPGHVEFTMLSDSQNAPSNLSVINHQVDENSQVIDTEQKNVEDWVQNPEGWVGRVAFDQDSQIKCFASLHKGHSHSAGGFSGCRERRVCSGERTLPMVLRQPDDQIEIYTGGYLDRLHDQGDLR